MADLALIVLSMLPATADVKVSPAEAPTETEVQVDFLSLLNGELSGLPEEQMGQTSTPVKAPIRGKGLPQQDDSGNVFPVSLMTPPTVSVAAVLLKADVDSQVPKAASEPESNTELVTTNTDSGGIPPAIVIETLVP